VGIKKILSVGVFVAILWNLPDEVRAQTPFVKLWVDAVDGDDSNHDGSEEEPYRTITHAVSQANSLIGSGKAEIYVSGRTQGGSPVTYNDDSGNSNPETFPLAPKKDVSILRDTENSESGVPVIIESTTDATILVLGSRSLSYTGLSKFQSLTFKAGDPAVYLYTKANNQSVKPLFHACTFIDNKTGVSGQAGSGGTLANTEVSPTIRFSTFTTSGELEDGLDAHVYLCAVGSTGLSNNQVKGSLHQNSLTIHEDDAGAGYKVLRGIHLKAITHSTAAPTLSGNTIDGNTDATAGGGVYFGVYARSSSSSSIAFSLTGGSVTECGGDGIYIRSGSDSSPPPLQPTISNATITSNGFARSPELVVGSGVTIIGDPHARFYPEVSGNTIEQNRNHGVAVKAYHQFVIGSSLVSPTVSNNTVAYNGPASPSIGDHDGSGIFLCAEEARIEGRIEKNTVQGNARHGISIVARLNAGYHTPRVTTEVVNNLIRYHSDSNVSGTGINMVTFFGDSSEIWPKIVHNTVVGNYDGIVNRDAYLTPNPEYHSSGLRVYNTIMWGNNNKDCGDMDMNTQQVYYCDWNYGNDNDNHQSNKHMDPEFDADGYHLTSDSPLIDAATEAPPVSAILLDWDGDDRTIDYDGNDTSIDNDMGVDEVTTS